MKKLNRKGFTLVELLAVIIILAIVVGITIPAVLTTTNKAKEKAFANAATSAADWFERQYTVATTGLDSTGLATLDPTFKSVCGDEGADCASTANTKWVRVTDATSAAGLTPSNIENMWIYINPNTGRACLKLQAAQNGDYYGTKTDQLITVNNCGVTPAQP